MVLLLFWLYLLWLYGTSYSTTTHSLMTCSFSLHCITIQEKANGSVGSRGGLSCYDLEALRCDILFGSTVDDEINNGFDGNSSPSLITTFFDHEGLQRILTFLCNARAPGTWDPVTATVLDLLTGKLHFCLTASGLAPFKGRPNMVYPYHMMTSAQKDYLREKLSERTSYCVCNDAILFHGGPEGADKLDPVSVLEALCSRILASKVHSDHKVRVGVCNIILQRVQSVVPISRNVQQQLNTVLFGN